MIIPTLVGGGVVLALALYAMSQDDEENAVWLNPGKVYQINIYRGPGGLSPEEDASNRAQLESMGFQSVTLVANDQFQSTGTVVYGAIYGGPKPTLWEPPQTFKVYEVG